MALFKCIGCGEIKESKNACSCPVCGYRMFEAPYVRREKLSSEIEGFFSRLEVKNVRREDLVFEGKDKDDQRFPDYDKILRYISGKDRTEDFLKNLRETTEQLKLHFTSQFSKTYSVSFQKLDEGIGRYDEVLSAAARILFPGISAAFDPVVWGKRRFSIRKHRTGIFGSLPRSFLV